MERNRAVRTHLHTILNGRTQVSLADAVGMHPTRISEYVHAKKTPSLNTALKIAHALDCSIHDIWTLED